MAREEIVNGASGAVVRTQINSMTAELYSMVAGNTEAPVVSKTSGYTLQLVDRGSYILATVSDPSSMTLIVPLNSNVAFPINTEIMIERTGTGAVSIDVELGVTLNSVSGKTSISSQYQTVALKKVGTDTWTLFGALP